MTPLKSRFSKGKCEMSIIRYFIIFMLQLMSLRSSLTQEEWNHFELNPWLSNEENFPYISAMIPTPRQNAREGLTFCAWIKITYFGRPTVAFSLKEVNSDDWYLSLAILPNGLILRKRETSVVLPFSEKSPILPMKWGHFCVSVTASSINLFYNENLVHSSFYPGNELFNNSLQLFGGGGLRWPDITPSTVGKLIFEENFFSNSNQEFGNFYGIIMNLNIWDTNLSAKQIKTLYNCSSIGLPVSKVSIISQNPGVTSSRISETYPCTQQKSNYFVMPYPLSFEENSNVCQKLQLSLLKIDDEKNYTELYRQERDLKICDEGKLYAWVHLTENTSAMKPHSGADCVALTSFGQTKINCKERLCSGCQFEESGETLYILRGLCSLDQADLSFIVQKNATSHGYYFHGIEKYNIIQNKEQWVLYDEMKQIILASTKLEFTPIGMKEWEIKNKFCGIMKGEIINVSLSSCKSDEILCGDGSCISQNKRCDFYPDCLDSTDEMDCADIRSSDERYSAFPPVPFPLHVKVTIEIMRIISTPPEKPVTLLLETKLEWIDQRLKLQNLRPMEKTLLTTKQLWRPKFVVFKTDESNSHNEQTEEEASGHSLVFSQVQREILTAYTTGEPLPDSRDSPFKDMVYPGENTTLSLSEIMIQTLDCDFDFTFFPFDGHLCKLSLVISSWPASHVMLKTPVIGRYTGPPRLVYYNVDDTKFEPQLLKINGKIYSGVQLTLYLDRRSSLQVLTVYLPTIILLILNSSTLWMTGVERSFPMAQLGCVILIVILLDWLLLTNYSPKTGHLTAIDAWLCFCTIFSLLHIGVHVLLEIFNEENQSDPFSRLASRVPSAKVRDVKPVDPNTLYDGILLKVAQLESAKLWSVPYWILFIARVVSPILLIFFNGAYWPFVLYFNQIE